MECKNPFPCPCNGPTLLEQQQVHVALESLFAENNTPLPLFDRKKNIPLLSQYTITVNGCTCKYIYSKLTTRLIDMIEKCKITRRAPLKECVTPEVCLQKIPAERCVSCNQHRIYESYHNQLVYMIGIFTGTLSRPS